jgi:alpha-N-arabinofuranosidase
LITSESLGKAKIPAASFENPDGSPLKVDKDYFGKDRSGNNILAGPFTGLEIGKVTLKVW